MPSSPCFLFKNAIEFQKKAEIGSVPKGTRGIYVLFHSDENEKMNVVYIGMARGEKSGVKGRLRSHLRSKKELWTHFSVFEVWENITSKQVEELEGLFRQIYSRDSSANKLNRQKKYKPLRTVTRKSFSDWIPQTHFG